MKDAVVDEICFDFRWKVKWTYDYWNGNYSNLGVCESGLGITKMKYAILKRKIWYSNEIWNDWNEIWNHWNETCDYWKQI